MKNIKYLGVNTRKFTKDLYKNTVKHCCEKEDQ